MTAGVASPRITLRALGAIAIAAMTCSGATSRAPIANAPFAVAGLDSVRHRVALVASNGSPWRDWRDAPSEHFVAYEDGLVLFRSGASAWPELREAHVDPAVVRALIDAIADDGLFALEHEISVCAATDLPRESVLVRRGDHWHGVEASGLDRFGAAAWCVDAPPPPALVATLRRLAAFDVADSKPWVADEIDVWFSDCSVHAFDAGPIPTTPWPASLPEPVVDPRLWFAHRVYDRRFEGLVAAIPRDECRHPVAMAGRRWIVSLGPKPVPELESIEAVSASLGRLVLAEQAWSRARAR